MLKFLKKPILTLFLFGILFGLLVTPKAWAQNTPESVVLEKTETVNHDYFGAGSSVTIHGTVNGDAYIFGGTVTIDGIINGDLIIAGGTVTVGGEVKNDVRAAGGTIVIEGKIGGNILSGGGTITLARSSTVGGSLIAGGGIVNINTPIGKTIWVGGGQTNINSNLKGDVQIGGDEIILDSEAKLEGNLTYWSDRQVRLLDGATVSGTIRREAPQRERDYGRRFFGIALGFGLMVKITSLATLLILGLLLLKFFPKKTLAVSEQVSKSPLASFGWGVGVTIMSLFAVVILMVAVFGIPLALLILVAWGIGLCLSEIFVGFWLGRKLFSNFDSAGRYHWALILGLVLLEIITLLPLVGWIAQIAAVFIGFGALLRVKKQTYEELRNKL